MRIGIHQPNFMPWIGYFHKIAMVDKFVFFDHVQFPRGKSFASRVLIKTNNGPLWLTVPVKGKGDCNRICDIEIDHATGWARKMLKTIELTYRKAPGFDWLFPELAPALEEKHQFISELNQRLIKLMSAKLGLQAEFVKSSEMSLEDNLAGDEVIFQIVHQLSGDTYVSGRGAGSARYINHDACAARNIALEYMSFLESPYPQLRGAFLPKMSIIDLLMNCGEDSRRLVTATAPVESEAAMDPEAEE